MCNGSFRRRRVSTYRLTRSTEDPMQVVTHHGRWCFQSHSTAIMALPQKLQTHRAYAKQHGFDYVLVHNPPLSALFMECCWQAPLIMSALAQGRDGCSSSTPMRKIRSTCPDFRSLARSGKSLLHGARLSGRVISGVISSGTVRIHEFSQTVSSILPSDPAQTMSGC